MKLFRWYHYLKKSEIFLPYKSTSAFTSGGFSILFKESNKDWYASWIDDIPRWEEADKGPNVKDSRALIKVIFTAKWKW
jgi:hypothetical protein